MAGKRAPREIRTSALRNALIMQMLMGIDEMWSIRDRHLQKRRELNNLPALFEERCAGCVGHRR